MKKTANYYKRKKSEETFVSPQNSKNAKYRRNLLPQLIIHKNE